MFPIILGVWMCPQVMELFGRFKGLFLPLPLSPLPLPLPSPSSPLAVPDVSLQLPALTTRPHSAITGHTPQGWEAQIIFFSSKSHLAHVVLSQQLVGVGVGRGFWVFGFGLVDCLALLLRLQFSEKKWRKVNPAPSPLSFPQKAGFSSGDRAQRPRSTRQKKGRACFMSPPLTAALSYFCWFPSNGITHF